jgi:hypothetical protein
MNLREEEHKGAKFPPGLCLWMLCKPYECLPLHVDGAALEQYVRPPFKHCFFKAFLPIAYHGTRLAGDGAKELFPLALGLPFGEAPRNHTLRCAGNEHDERARDKRRGIKDKD